MKKNPWNPSVQAALKRVLPRALYLRFVGRHERGSLQLWREMAAKVPADRAILDIGSYRGDYALAAREVNESAPVYAFEPNPKSNELLRGICRSHGIILEEVAVSERSGTVHLMMDSQRSQIADHGVPVRALSLDDWRKMRDVRVTLMKIDTEGAEAGILRGAAKLVAESQPTIICEVLTDAAGVALMEVLPTYCYFRIDEDRGTEERARITREEWRHKNWLLVPH